VPIGIQHLDSTHTDPPAPTTATLAVNNENRHGAIRTANTDPPGSPRLPRETPRFSILELTSPGSAETLSLASYRYTYFQRAIILYI